MKTKGKTMIKVVSILMLIGGVFNILASIIGLAGGGLVAVGGAGDPTIAAEASTLATQILINAVMCLIYGVVFIITSIIGIKNCSKVEQAAKCKKWGIIALAIAVISLIVSFLIGMFEIASIGILILPILFIVGAHMNTQTGT